MLNASAEFIREMNNDNRNFLPYIDITLSDNTVLNLTPAEIWENTFKIEDATSAVGKFTIGAAVSTKVSFTINNIYDDYSQYDFAKATAVVKVGLKLQDNTIEKLLIGFFTAVDDPAYNGSTISLTLLDNLYKFNKSYKNTNLVYPATLLHNTLHLHHLNHQDITFHHESSLRLHPLQIIHGARHPRLHQFLHSMSGHNQ